MRLHAREILRAWRETYPEDVLIVIGPRWLAEDIEAEDGFKHFWWPNESVLSRATGQLFVSPAARVFHRAQALVSLSPIVSPLANKRSSFCFQHDWRHKKNPEEFSTLQRTYRKLWEISARKAKANFCISSKAVEETEFYVPRATTVLVENGHDHARRWEPVSSADRPAVPTIVTFGHHNNKRPELLIAAIAELARRDIKLVVTGATGAYREELIRYATELGVRELVDFPGFVTEGEYRRLISTASCIALVSSDEGFGLPLAEAEFFGIPAVVTSDSGVASLFHGAIFETAPTSSAVAAAVDSALESGVQLDVERDFVSWHDAVHTVRSEILA